MDDETRNPFALGIGGEKGGKVRLMLLEEAAEQYREALRRKADCVEALINLGHVLQGLGRPEEARECWRTAVQTRPDVAGEYFGKS